MTVVIVFLALAIILIGVAQFAIAKSIKIGVRSHTQCIAQVAHYTGDLFAAQVLEAAAAEFDAQAGQAELSRIANTIYTIGGPSVPKLYLTERARKIREQADLPHCGDLTCDDEHGDER